MKEKDHDLEGISRQERADMLVWINRLIETSFYPEMVPDYKDLKRRLLNAHR